ncbi:helix-turn-helix domain-containing protein [Methanospirillum purgamenti]|uniref:AlbA family DNA-binding domain-containing protein n=1 Tax=Methanospirillum purgamenti TaxID=2834276 RepID=UPI0020297D9E
MGLYSGRFYSGLGERGIQKILSSQHHFLIISGLYGLVTPTEFIQLYECPLEDLPEYQQHWQNNDELSKILINYIEENQISNILDFSAQYVYTYLINWKIIENIPDLAIFHAHNVHHISDEALKYLGKSVGDKFLSMNDSDFREIVNSYQYKDTILSKDILPPDEWPIEELRKIELLIRKGESRWFEYKASLTGREFDNLNDRENPIQFTFEKFRVMKAVVSFLNTDGGELLIGIRDEDKAIIGIEEDLNQYENEEDKEDYYRLIFEEMITIFIGKIFADKISSQIIHLQNKPLLLISVKKSKIPAYILRNDKGKERRQFYVRQNNSMRKLDENEQLQWITEHEQVSI